MKKILFDFFPILLFFIAYKAGGIFIATGVAIAASFLQIGWVMLRGQKVDKTMWISLVIITVLGGATLISQNETFVKWKPTALYGFFALSLITGSLVFKKNLLRSMLEEKMALPDPAWQLLNRSWVVFFIFMAAANLFVAYNYPTDTWVNFKLFGGIGLMLVFVVIQSIMLSKYLKDDEILAGSASTAIANNPADPAKTSLPEPPQSDNP